MKIVLPHKHLLMRTNDVDYFEWNYRFPIKYVQLYRYKTIIRLLGNKIYPHLLEVGTGSGISLPELARHCDKLFASDIHPYINDIKPLLEFYKVNNFEMKTESVQRTSYPDNYFDAIVAVSVLEFIDDIEAALSEIKRILKKDGVFITIYPMYSKLLDSIVSIYADKTAEEEFGESRNYVCNALEKNFSIINKGYMLPLVGKHFPVYTHYKLKK